MEPKIEDCNNIHLNGNANPSRGRTKEVVDGINNWIVLLFGVFIIQLVIGNYTRYGIIKDPISITMEFLEFLKIKWWCLVVPFACLLAQILLSYVTEKFLAKGWLSNSVGMAIHAFNSLLSFNVCTVVIRWYDLNPILGIVMVAHIFLMSIKFWSYAHVNRKYRMTLKRDMAKTENSEKSDKEKGSIKYPENVTLQDVIEFILHTPASMYNIKGPRKKSPDYVRAVKGIFRAIVIYYSCAILLYQYIIPEVHAMMKYLETQQYLKMLEGLLKITLPLDALWLLFFHQYCFRFYLPLLGWLGGTEDVVLDTDWWNSENTAVFWTKWNYQVHMWLKECFFLPMLEMGYSKKVSAVTVGLISGILHEYLISIPCRSSYGMPTMSMLIQIPLSSLTAFVQKRYGGKWGNLLVWSSFVLGHPVCAILMYYNYTKLELH